MDKHRRLLFLDVDGVLNRYGSGHEGKLDPELITNLNMLMFTCDLEIVLNSAWNAFGVEKVRADFKAAGFETPKSIIGTTARNCGGGFPVRKYLIDNDIEGIPYIIIDDGTHNYGEMWCRLARCDGRKGFTTEVLRRAEDLVFKCARPLEQRDREMAASFILEHTVWLSKASWLSEEQKRHYIAADFDIATHCLTTPDFMEAAMLVPKLPASSESEG